MKHSLALRFCTRILGTINKSLQGKKIIMTEETKTLSQLKKASKLTRLAFHKNGPKSFKRGQGALLNALLEHDGETQRELVGVLGVNRGELKGIVKKAARNGYVTIGEVDEVRTYTIHLTETGRTLAEKRDAANDRAAADILACLNAEERAELDTITEKIILSMKEKGISGKHKGRKSACYCAHA